jgi:cytidylate kinase
VFVASLTIVSGSPGAGKTTLSSRLAKGAVDGLHIPSDLFYSFPANPIDPTLPESRSQNEAIILALGASSAVFLESGYDVFVDGIVGPWFLPTLLEAIPRQFPVAYLLLTVTQEEALSRVRDREGRGLSAKVRSTRSSFAESEQYEDHKLDTTHLDAESVYRIVERRLARGEFRLSR